MLPVGLPKLDRLRDEPISDGGHILFLGQSAPDATVMRPLLKSLRDELRMPVKVRPHPGHPSTYEPLQEEFEFLSVLDDPIAQIATCSLFLSTHSTALLEALYLGKNAVLLPSFGLTDCTFYPGIAVDFTADKVVAALKKVRREQAGIERFLHQTCGGRRHDSTERAVRAIDAVLAERPADDWWRKPGKLRTLFAGEHPLCTA